ncbi:hypothetical protein C8J56DRAFT_913377 [Mycena floridula]|nr:hypothetical protein C8J56DRAFT_913377 [Mycena floridula]
MATGDPGDPVVEAIQTTMDPRFSSFSKSPGAHRHPGSSHRPTPYPIRSMLGEVPGIDRLLDELTTFNAASTVSYYSREEHAVVEWDCGGLGFATLQNSIDTRMLEAPRCIHAANPLFPLDHTSRNDANASYTGYLMAVSHPCSFKSYIPNLNLQKRAPSTDVEENGLFLKFGPLSGFCHISLFKFLRRGGFRCENSIFRRTPNLSKTTAKTKWESSRKATDTR